MSKPQLPQKLTNPGNPLPIMLCWSSKNKYYNLQTIKRLGTSLVVQWLRLYPSNAGGPGEGTGCLVLQLRSNAAK